MKGARLRMQGLPLGLGGGALAIGLEGRELLLERGLLGLKAGIGGEGRVVSRFQFGLLGGGQDGVFVELSSTRAGRGRG